MPAKTIIAASTGTRTAAKNKSNFFIMLGVYQETKPRFREEVCASPISRILSVPS